VPSVPKPFLMGQGQNRHPAHGTTLGSGDPQCSQESAASESESGFTLVELLIVIVILGILSGIVVFSVSGITSCGANAACNSDVASVTVASEAFYAQTGPIRRPSPRSCHNSSTQLLPPKPLPLPPPASSRRPPSAPPSSKPHGCSGSAVVKPGHPYVSTHRSCAHRPRHARSLQSIARKRGWVPVAGAAAPADRSPAPGRH
jgi:prepilin-type N-terminal cleavage/methylation domain-containing protein